MSRAADLQLATQCINGCKYALLNTPACPEIDVRCDHPAVRITPDALKLAEAVHEAVGDALRRDRPHRVVAEVAYRTVIERYAD